MPFIRWTLISTWEVDKAVSVKIELFSIILPDFRTFSQMLRLWIGERVKDPVRNLFSVK